jgi:diguanylate cyclase (GGDEF)-like protein
VALALAEREKKRVGVLAVDMDGLKPINDNHGHRAGDAALRELGARLQKAARVSDTVARLGGDEFGIILSGVDDRAAAEQAVRRFSDALAPGELDFEGTTLPLRASVGLALFADDATDLAALLDFADQAMYTDKRRRKSEKLGSE